METARHWAGTDQVELARGSETCALSLTDPAVVVTASQTTLVPTATAVRYPVVVVAAPVPKCRPSQSMTGAAVVETPVVAVTVDLAVKRD